MTGSVREFFSTADNITATLVAAFVISQTGRSLYVRTIGSRRVAARAIRSLTPGNPIELIEDRFGLPLYSQTYSQEPLDFETAETYLIEQRLYNAKHGWLTVHYNKGKLCAFAFMLTDPKFKFSINATSRGVLSGTLGRTGYFEIWPHTPPHVELFLAAYNWGYAEANSYGRGGNHQTYILANTMNGWTSMRGSIEGYVVIDGGANSLDDASVEDLATIDRYRRASAPDTIGLVGEGFRITNWNPCAIAYDQDDLRNLEGVGPRGWLSNSNYLRHIERERKMRTFWRRVIRIGLKDGSDGE